MIKHRISVMVLGLAAMSAFCSCTPEERSQILGQLGLTAGTIGNGNANGNTNTNGNVNDNSPNDNSFDDNGNDNSPSPSGVPWHAS